jgi:hypothetical protein
MVEPHEALVIKRIGTVTVGLYAHRRYLDRVGRPRTLDGLQKHSLIGFDRETPEIRSMRKRNPGLEAAVHFAFRTDSDIAQRDPGRVRNRLLPTISSACCRGPCSSSLAYGGRCMRISDRRRAAVPPSTDLQPA